MSILSSLPSGEIEFIQEDIGVTIKPIAKRVKFQLKSQASVKFPELVQEEIFLSLSFLQKTLRK
jgi:DNA polymerase-3 subunit beta